MMGPEIHSGVSIPFSAFKVIVNKAREGKSETGATQCGVLIRSCWPSDAETQIAMAHSYCCYRECKALLGTECGVMLTLCCILC